MRNKHGDFIWYELMTTDADAAEAFYSGLVGWSFAASGQPDMDYRLFSADGPAVGGFMALTDEMQQGGARPLWAGYIGVDDVDATAKAVGEADGMVMVEPTDIPGVGRFAFVTDPEGAPFYIMRGEQAKDKSSTLRSMSRFSMSWRQPSRSIRSTGIRVRGLGHISPVLPLPMRILASMEKSSSAPIKIIYLSGWQALWASQAGRKTQSSKHTGLAATIRSSLTK